VAENLPNGKQAGASTFCMPVKSLQGISSKQHLTAIELLRPHDVIKIRQCCPLLLVFHAKSFAREVGWDAASNRVNMKKIPSFSEQRS
jgi:hypothetical protein